jgi:hypothetical protein
VIGALVASAPSAAPSAAPDRRDSVL